MSGYFRGSHHKRKFGTMSRNNDSRCMYAKAAGRLEKLHQSPVTAAPPAQPPAGSSVRSARQPLLGSVVPLLPRPLLEV